MPGVSHHDICKVCDRHVPLNKDGRTRRHKGTYLGKRGLCRGSGRFPRSVIEDHAVMLAETERLRERAADIHHAALHDFLETYVDATTRR